MIKLKVIVTGLYKPGQVYEGSCCVTIGCGLSRSIFCVSGRGCRSCGLYCLYKHVSGFKRQMTIDSTPVTIRNRTSCDGIIATLEELERIFWVTSVATGLMLSVAPVLPWPKPPWKVYHCTSRKMHKYETYFSFSKFAPERAINSRGGHFVEFPAPR